MSHISTANGFFSFSFNFVGSFILHTLQSLNAVTCIMYTSLLTDNSEYKVFLIDMQCIFYTLTLNAISLYCSKNVFQVPQVLLKFLQLKFLYAAIFSTSYFLNKMKRSSTIFGFFCFVNRYRGIEILLF